MVLMFDLTQTFGDILLLLYNIKHILGNNLIKNCYDISSTGNLLSIPLSFNSPLNRTASESFKLMKHLLYTTNTLSNR